MIEASVVKSAINPRQFYELRLPDLKSGDGWVDGGSGCCQINRQPAIDLATLAALRGTFNPNG